MKHAVNAAEELGTQGWSMPWSAGGDGGCVEIKNLGGGVVAVRQSTDPDGPALICPSTVFAEFVGAAKEGRADFLIA
ncbi:MULTISPECIES: DUF397 domain-containing protein [unclassified Streptomyces]|uniref:DUF397 domain-containing protein n=1 Tax=unclassified Streptomyces TaxID=2593676 RepID=UPI00342CE7A6